MPDPFDAPRRIGGTQEVELDLAAFLPEGTSVAPDVDSETAHTVDTTFDDGDGTDTDERTAASAVVAADPMSNPVDVAALARIEGELGEVDAALLALDAGDLSQSALLGQLLAHDPPYRA